MNTAEIVEGLLELIERRRATGTRPGREELERLLRCREHPQATWRCSGCIGAAGGRAKSERKAKASRENWRKGGRRAGVTAKGAS